MKPRYPFALGLAFLLSWLLGVGPALTAAETSSAPKSKAAPAKRPSNSRPSKAPPLLPLPQDPALRTGKLRNGLRYAIYPNKKPEGRASLRLVVRAGSLHETDEQRGLAHFLEHMAFAGSTHYPPGKLVEFFQRMGMRIGADTNALTGFDRTMYILELPNTDKETLAEAFQVFGDYAGGLLLLDEEIERERAVVLSEKRERDSAVYRAQVASLEFILGDSLVPKRLPIGEESVIRSAGREQLLDFWNTWYRPERMMIVAVGDFDARKVESQLRKAFSRLKARAPARPEPDLGELTKLDGNRTFYYYEPEAHATTIRIATVQPYFIEHYIEEATYFSEDSMPKRMMDLVADIAFQMFNRRLAALAQQEGAPFLAARVTRKDEFRFYRSAAIEVSTRAEQWREALAMAEREMRRVADHGFRDDELAEAVAEFRTAIEVMGRNAGNRQSGAMADGIAEALYQDRVVTHPHFDYALLKPILDEIKPELCQRMLGIFFGNLPGTGRGSFISVVGNAVINEEGEDPTRTILNVGRVASQVPVEPLAERETAEWAYANWGAPGTVVSDERVADLDLRLLRFANGVRLNFKKTDFEPGLVRVWLRVGEGRITAPVEQPGLGSLAELTFSAIGLGAHSSEELQRIFAGRQGGALFKMGDDAFSFQGQTFSKDLQMYFQSITAQLTDPGWRPEALRQAHRMIELMYLNFKHSSEGKLLTELASLTTGGDPRLSLPEESVLLSRTMEELRDWLGPQLAQGPLEISVVGDFEPDTLIATVAETFGALPARAEKRDLSALLAQVKAPEQPFNETYRVPTEINKGEVGIFWKTANASDARSSLGLELLKDVLEERLRVQVREKMGASYSPSAAHNSTDVLGFGYMVARSSVDPAQAQQVADLIQKIGDDLAQHGVTSKELNQARKQYLNAFRQLQRNNLYWLTRFLAQAQEKPETLAASRARQKHAESITAAELSELARTYLGAARASRIIVLPEPKEKS